MITRGRTPRLSARHERSIYVVLILAYVSGIAWMGLHYGVNRGVGLEDKWRIAENWLLKSHGAAAMAALIAFGSMLPIHVPSAWNLKRNLASGLGMFTTLIVLAATGWLLYYASGETARAWSGYVHMAAGFFGPLILLWHLTCPKQLGRKDRRP